MQHRMATPYYFTIYTRRKYYNWNRRWAQSTLKA